MSDHNDTAASRLVGHLGDAIQVDGYVDIVYYGKPRRVPYAGTRPSYEEAWSFVHTQKMLWRSMRPWPDSGEGPDITQPPT